MPLPVTAFYAGLLAMIYVALSLRVIFDRGRAKADFGDAGDESLRRRIRVHGNFAEYVPFALILLGLDEGLQAPSWLLNLLGAALLFGRATHIFGVSRLRENMRYRVTGMVFTFAMMSVAALLCLVLAVQKS